MSHNADGPEFPAISDLQSAIVLLLQQRKEAEEILSSKAIVASEMSLVVDFIHELLPLIHNHKELGELLKDPRFAVFYPIFQEVLEVKRSWMQPAPFWRSQNGAGFCLHT